MHSSGGFIALPTEHFGELNNLGVKTVKSTHKLKSSFEMFVFFSQLDLDFLPSTSTLLRNSPPSGGGDRKRRLFKITSSKSSHCSPRPPCVHLGSLTFVRDSFQF